MKYTRVDRLEGEILNQISWLIVSGGLKEPNIPFITVTSVKMSPDLKNGTVYYTVYGDNNERERACDILHKTTSLIRREIGKKVRMKFLPQFRFEYDDVESQAQKVDDLLRQVSKERDFISKDEGTQDQMEE